MTDIERGRIGGDEDRLPWLEPVESDIDEPGVGAGKLIAAVVVALLAIGLVIGGLFWLRERGAEAVDPATSGDLIAAPAGDYKVAPSDPGGMNVAGEGDATYAASQGVPVDAAIDISKRPEAPLAAARAAEPVKPVAIPPSKAATPAPVPATKPADPVAIAKAPEPKPAPKPTPTPAKPPEVVQKPATKPAPARPVEVAKTPEPAKPAAAAAGGIAVQLGAFGSEAKAHAVWKDLAGRFPALRGLSHSVSLTDAGGKKLYRLRAPVGGKDKASAVCRALTSAREACNVVG